VRRISTPTSVGSTSAASDTAHKNLATAVRTAELAVKPAGRDAMIAAGTAAAVGLGANQKDAAGLATAVADAILRTGESNPGDLGADWKAGVGQIGKGLTGWVGDLFRAFLPILKIGAGGAGLIVTGLALVYVAGRNTPAVGAAKTAVKVATPVGRAASMATGGRARAAARSEARSRRAQIIREEARSRTEIVQGRRGERVRTVSRAKGRENRESEDAARYARQEANRRDLSAPEARRRGFKVTEGIG
jgi:hypothetical protein